MRRERTLLGWIFLLVTGVAAVLIILLLAGRYGVLLPQARSFIEARSSGLKLGRFGKLKIEGLQGDIWRDFSIRRVTITDEKGVWLEGDAVEVKWSMWPLFNRRLVIDNLQAQRIEVWRRPSLAPKGKSSATPLSVVIRSAKAQIETQPAFSTRHGLFDAAVKLDLERAGGQSGEVVLDSLLHAGDHLHARFDLPQLKPFTIDAEAMESQGGALAGAAGLPAAQPFSAKVSAHGSPTGGALTVRVFSGAAEPAQADGAWTANGGEVQGQASLAASSLLRSYAKMFGPQVNFAVAARRANSGLYGMGAHVRAENLVFAAKGAVDPVRRAAPAGLDVDVLVPQLKRVIDVPYFTAGRATGRIAGKPSAWSFRGGATVAGVSFNGYTLVRVSGPLKMSLAKGELRAEAALGGAGGKGRGLLSTLAGAAPKLFVDLSRLKDGRVLIHSLRLVGAGFQLTGSGSQSLFGGLAFTGQAQMAQIGRLKPGASGDVTAGFKANQAPGRDKPWLLTFDAQGVRLHSGLAELDRLLGPTPRLQASGSFRGDVVQIASAHLTAAAANANAAGVIKASGPMNLTLDWTAKGPFEVGPVQIAGDWRGKGTVGGTFASPSADLTAHIAQVDIPKLPLRDLDVALKLQKIADIYDGTIGLSGVSTYGPARARAAYRFMPDGVDLSQIDADGAGVRAQGSVSLRGGAPSTADLKLAIGPGLLLEKGEASGTVRIAKAAGPVQADLELTAAGAVLRGAPVVLQTARLSASGPLSHLPYHLTAEGASGVTPFSIDGAGVYQMAGQQQSLSLSGHGQVRKVDFRTTDPLLVQVGPGGRSVHARIATLSGEASIEAHDGKGGLNANAALSNIDLKAFGRDFLGKIDAKVALSGQGSRLDGQMSAHLTGARTIGSPEDQALSGEVTGRLNDTTLTLSADAASAAGLKAQAQVTLPTEASASPLRLAVVRTRPMSGKFDIDGQIKPLWDVFFGGDRSLAGEVQVKGVLAGTLADPKVTGHAGVQNGAFEDYATGVKLTKLQADASLGKDSVTLTSLTANDNKQGQVSGSGTLSLDRGGASNLTLKLTDFRLIDNDTATANATGQVKVVREATGKVSISGDLTLDKAAINAEAKLKPSLVTMDVTEINRPEKFASQIVPSKSRGPTATLDVRLRAPGKVLVRGRGITAELSIFAHVTGTTTSPNLEGTARVVSGFYDFGGRRFDFEQRGSITLANDPEHIRFDLQATLDDPTLTATVMIHGTAARPEVTLTSTPSLPQDEILAYIIFGRSASQLSSPEAAQMASALSSLAAGGGFDVLGNLRQFAGLDRLAFGADTGGGVTVAGGKYVTNNIYVELVGGGVYGPSAQVDWRVKRSFSIVSTLGGQFGSKIAVRWRHDLGGRRGRPTTQGGASAPPPPNR